MNSSSTTITISGSSDEKYSASAVGTIAGISVGVTLVVAFPLGAVVGFCGTILCLMKRKRGFKTDSSSGHEEDKREEVYEEPVAVAPVETVFSLSDNQAYGQVNIQGSS